MREIAYQEIVKTVATLCVAANTTRLPALQRAIELAHETEASPVGKAILGDVLENFSYAAAEQLPICQDTGMAVVFAELGQEAHITGGLLEDAVNEGVARGYTEGMLRCSVVSDPLHRENTGDNTPAVLHIKLVAGDTLKITVAPKGFGSENMTALKMFTPAATQEDIIQFIVDTVDKAGSNPCPPIVVGVGLGGTSEKAALLAKEALLEDVDSLSNTPYYAEMEAEALRRINALGIGPQGLGGTTTALSVRILPYPTHIAGLPCCVNLGCHVTRHTEEII